MRDLKIFPEDVIDEIGYVLNLVQEGEMPRKVKPLKGLGDGVMEIKSDFDTNTFRSVFVINLDDKIYVLHCFQKKSKQGIKTPLEEINVVKQRLKLLKSYLED